MNILDTLKILAMRFLDVLVILLVLAVGLSLIFINGAFITNIINSLLAGQYIGIDIGIQIVLVTLAMVWIPIFIIRAAAVPIPPRKRRG